jgi:hypothetical protein
MKITKGEATVLNLWEHIKKIKKIDENDPDSIINYFNKTAGGNGCSFLPEFLLNPRISNGTEFELTTWDILALCKLINDEEKINVVKKDIIKRLSKLDIPDCDDLSDHPDIETVRDLIIKSRSMGD